MLGGKTNGIAPKSLRIAGGWLVPLRQQEHVATSFKRQM